MPLPPGPTSWAPWQLIQWIRSPFSMMRDCAATYGDVFTLRAVYGAEPVVFCCDPEALRVLLGNDEGPAITAPGELNAIFAPLLGPQSVIALSGERHRRMRQLLMPPFHGERMRSYGEVIRAICQDEADLWHPGTPIEVRPAMQRISMRVILQTVFGLREGSRLDRIEASLVDLLDTSSQPLGTVMIFASVLQRDLGRFSPWGRFLRKRQAVDALLFEEMAERRARTEQRGDDILSLLLEARDEEGQPLTDNELRDELLTLLVAGHETTATALSWALYWLATRPEVQEVFPDPEHFDPDRFLSDSFSPTTFMPFGGGSRRCIGMAFALFEMKVVLSQIITRFVVELDAATPLPARPERRGLTAGITPVWLRLKDAEPADAKPPLAESHGADNPVL